MLVSLVSIEGNPFITRFKTPYEDDKGYLPYACIEGNPFITRFKTSSFISPKVTSPSVLKVIHL